MISIVPADTRRPVFSGFLGNVLYLTEIQGKKFRPPRKRPADVISAGGLLFRRARQ
ncbi:hypothetical protein [Roseobacter ponti]|uniref:Uncharacterized protein n=1 Tax=Roseobacter ponti TaxID=1891787 RepID=A0A858T0J6_9RHOB|nr:hypothetical protein [Roseobacter ponti]QJF52726.1 hypothetical protein G3256_16875 [Roseobacter ponti]